MTFNRNHWGLTDYAPRPKIQDLEVDESAMIESFSVCKVCDHPVRVLTHRDFSPLCGDPLSEKQSENTQSGPGNSYQQMIDSFRGMATCDRCYDLRVKYQTARDRIQGVLEWVSRNYNPYEREWIAEADEQTKKLELLKLWLKKWGDAIRRMKNQVHIVDLQDAARIIWMRPKKADDFLAALEERLYEGQPVHEQEAGISKMLNQLRSSFRNG